MLTHSLNINVNATCFAQKLEQFRLFIALTNVIAPLVLCVMPEMDWQRQTCITAALLYFRVFHYFSKLFLNMAFILFRQALSWQV